MKAPLFPFVCLLALMFNPVHAESDIYQSINLALTQQSQSFDFESADRSLDLQGFRLGYQYGIDQWRFGVDYNGASDSRELSRSLNNAGFSLTSENSGIGFFAEYNWDNSWLGLGYGDSHTEHHYGFFNGSDKREIEDSIVDYSSATLDGGYLFATDSGQWILSASLIHQLIKEESHYVYNVPNPELDQNLDSIIDETGLLAGMGLHYGHYFPINNDWQLYLNAGLYRQVVLEGEARTQPSRKSQPIRLQSEDTLSQDASQSASTSQQLQFSLLHNQGNLNFNVDKLSNQKISEAYYSVGFGVNF